MTPNDNDIPTTENEFRTALAHLVTMSAAHGVDVEGTWLVMSGTPDDTVDWTVDIGSPPDPGAEHRRDV